MAKNKKPTTTVNVEAVKRESKRMAKSMAKEQAPGDMGTIIEPGTMKRQSPLEQEMGSRKYKDMIHDHNDKNKHILDRLPFTFPKKRIVRSHRSDVLIECVDCGHQSFGSEYTYMKICGGCGQSTKVINPEAERRGEDRDFSPGMFATATDILRLREEQEKKKDQ
jgi:hypothetical protein